MVEWFVTHSKDLFDSDQSSSDILQFEESLLFPEEIEHRNSLCQVDTNFSDKSEEMEKNSKDRIAMELGNTGRNESIDICEYLENLRTLESFEEEAYKEKNREVIRYGQEN